MSRLCVEGKLPSVKFLSCYTASITTTAKCVLYYGRVLAGYLWISVDGGSGQWD